MTVPSIRSPLRFVLNPSLVQAFAVLLCGGTTGQLISRLESMGLWPPAQLRAPLGRRSGQTAQVQRCS
jgi:hypothetical protein